MRKLVEVVFIESLSRKGYLYLTDNENIEVGDYIRVPCWTDNSLSTVFVRNVIDINSLKNVDSFASTEDLLNEGVDMDSDSVYWYRRKLKQIEEQKKIELSRIPIRKRAVPSDKPIIPIRERRTIPTESTPRIPIRERGTVSSNGYAIPIREKRA